MSLEDTIIYYIGLIVAFYFGYEIGSKMKEIYKKLCCLDRKMGKLDKKINGLDDNLTRKDIEKIMQSPKYWRDQDPESLKIVSDWFEKNGG